MKKFISFSGTTNIVSAVLLFLSWFSIGFFMWEEIGAMNFIGMVQNTAWIPINIVYLIATVLLLPGIAGWYLITSYNKGNLNFTAFLLTALGILWFSCIQYYETFIWPVIAAESSDLFNIVGFSPSSSLVSVPFLLSGIPWAFGYLITGIYMYRSSPVSKRTAVLYTLGAILFGVGMAFPIRTVGVILFCFGLIKTGSVLRSNG